jgi:hypothetical protein
MAKTRKSSPKVRPPHDPQRARALRLMLIRGLIAIILVAGSAAGYWRLRSYVRTQVAYSPQPPSVVLVNRPVWMSDGLADLIARHVRPAVGQSALDHQLLRDRVAILNNEPWIKRVNQVRRVYGQAPGDLLEIDCEYRAPIALVRWDDHYVLVDGDGVVLPERITKADVPRIVYGKNGRMNIRLIDGVSRRPPADGQRWTGDDLAAGLWMVKTLYGKPFAEEIMSVDVANYGGRENGNEAHLILLTRYGSEIRWGQSHNWRGFEASIDRKLANLEQVFHQYGRIDANEPWLDLRFDKVLRPEPPAHSASATLDH